jgi:hypothetical protein
MGRRTSQRCSYVAIEVMELTMPKYSEQTTANSTGVASFYPERWPDRRLFVTSISLDPGEVNRRLTVADTPHVKIGEYCRMEKVAEWRPVTMFCFFFRRACDFSRNVASVGYGQVPLY